MPRVVIEGPIDEKRLHSITDLVRDVLRVPFAAIYVEETLRALEIDTLVNGTTTVLSDFCDEVIAADGPVARTLPLPTNPGAQLADLADLRFLAGTALRGDTASPIGVLIIGDTEQRRLGLSELATLHRLGHVVEQLLSFRAELRRGAEIQRSLVSGVEPAVPTWERAAVCLPASQVGGSFLDWHTDEESRLLITMADVMGSGVGAGLLAATIRAVVRSTTATHGFPDTVDAAATLLMADLEAAGALCTLFAARCGAAGTVDYINAGNAHGFIISPGRLPHVLDSGLPVGLVAGQRWEASRVRLRPQDVLLVVSEGVLTLHGGLERTLVAAQLAINEGTALRELPSRLASPARSAGRRGDLTVVALRPLSEGPTGQP
jgi:hypothetical protein